MCFLLLARFALMCLTMRIIAGSRVGTKKLRTHHAAARSGGGGGSSSSSSGGGSGSGSSSSSGGGSSTHGAYRAKR